MSVHTGTRVSVWGLCMAGHTWPLHMCAVSTHKRVCTCAHVTGPVLLQLLWGWTGVCRAEGGPHTGFSQTTCSVGGADLHSLTLPGGVLAPSNGLWALLP